MAGISNYGDLQNPLSPYVQNQVMSTQSNSGNDKKSYKDALNALSDFRNKIFEDAQPITPSTNKGGFRAVYEPIPGVLTIFVKCEFKFFSKFSTKITPEAMEKAIKEKTVPEITHIEEKWDETEKKKFKEEFFSETLNWDSTFRFYCQKDWWENQQAFVLIKFSEASSTEAATINVEVRKEGDGSLYDTVTGRLLQMHQNSVTRTGRHEVGHVLGLGDEYPFDPKSDGKPAVHSELVQKEFGHPIIIGQWDPSSIMNTGPMANRIFREHGVIFQEALRRVTGIEEWKQTQKAARAIPN